MERENCSKGDQRGGEGRSGVVIVREMYTVHLEGEKLHLRRRNMRILVSSKEGKEKKLDRTKRRGWREGRDRWGGVCRDVLHAECVKKK